MTRADALLNAACEWAAEHPWTTLALIIGWIAGARFILGEPL
nr:hypothetical protein [Mesorhizobium sp.]